MNTLLHCDVLVIGAGGAGMAAAAAASLHGARVILVSKTRLLQGGATVMAPGSMAAVDEAWKDPGDGVAAHIRDTLACGAGLCDEALVEQTLTRAGSAVRFLEQAGAMFQRERDGRRLAKRITGGHSFARSVYLENMVGREIARTLRDMLAACAVQVIEEAFVEEPRFSGGLLSGASFCHVHEGGRFCVLAPSIILATGGAAGIYARTDNPADVTGDGFVFALRAGAALTDMEFVQFYPMGFLKPACVAGQIAAFPPDVMLFNSRGERFLKRYDEKRLEMTTRDLLSIAIATEVKEGRGTREGGVLGLLRHPEAAYIKKHQPGLYALYRFAEAEPSRGMLTVAPSAHFFQGGVQVDRHRMSRVGGLYAVGEAAAGVHGANRLGQNALTDMLVSGAVAGEHAAQYAAEHAAGHIGAEEARGEDGRRGPARSGSVRDGREAGKAGETTALLRRLRGEAARILQEEAGVLRNGPGLGSAVRRLSEMRREAAALREAVPAGDGALRKAASEAEALLCTAVCIAEAALRREESRGCHYREDFPETGAEAYHIVITEDAAGKLHFLRKPHRSGKPNAEETGVRPEAEG